MSGSSRQIGQSNEYNLLWSILKQLNKINGTVYSSINSPTIYSVAPGGLTNQVYTKIDDQDYNATWVTIDKNFIGLSNVDNIKQYPNSNPSGFETPTQLNTRDTNNRNRSNHTGTQTASTISDFQSSVTNNTSVLANTAKRSYPVGDETKLAGIATGATANSTDAQLRDRTTHTGLQAISTVTGLQTALDGKQSTLTNPVTVLATSPQIVDKRWFGTQAQYDALGTYNTTVEYNIL